MSYLGRGLESLIPRKEKAPEEPAALEVLETQAKLHEPVYQFHGSATKEAVLPVGEQVVAGAVSAELSKPLPSRAAPRQAGSVFWIEVSKIEPNPEQPRRDFNMDELLALAASVKEHGVLQPLLVTKREVETSSGLDVHYQLVSGERRWRAAKLAGLREVPVMIRTAELESREKLELALIENVQREDLNPMERARAFARLVDEFGMMQREVAERIGKSREMVANSLRVLRLPEEIQAALASSVITEGHARVLLMLENSPERQRALFSRITSMNLAVRDAELQARALGAVIKSRRSRKKQAMSLLDPDSRQLQRRLEEVFGTKVSLEKSGEHGRIIVEFYSDEELHGILDRISKQEEGFV